ncbi:MAG TPA: aminodeoxychorismate synthase component I [Saprospirales bacterium]|jgi:para-aminobenzoate synthetase component 1|nr:aminodeoxychorismate synthase component I [Saprospirales bacterium]
MTQTKLIQESIEKINKLGTKRIPFFFMIDFEMKKPIIYPLDELPDHIWYDLNGVSNRKANEADSVFFRFEPNPVSKQEYTKAFARVQGHLQYGNTFLLNLAFPSQVDTELSLEDVYHRSEAKYKLYLKDELVVFSPEIFVQIKDDYIYSYPMKGTIDAEAMGADLHILNDKKEIAEHSTIVDLIRNDLSMVAKEVRVTKFRYIDTIKTNVNKLHQVSSEIRGKLSSNFHDRLGSILFTLLPAGSISGAPKPKTLEIIREAELYDRGYYTGVFGIYDGETLDSGVMIRYIEQIADGSLQYRSGGGITAMSNLETEYQELIDKIYVPTH